MTLGDTGVVKLVGSISLPGKLGSRGHLVDLENLGPVHLTTVTLLLCRTHLASTDFSP